MVFGTAGWRGVRCLTYMLALGVAGSAAAEPPRVVTGPIQFPSDPAGSTRHQLTVSAMPPTTASVALPRSGADAVYDIGPMVSRSIGEVRMRHFDPRGLEKADLGLWLNRLNLQCRGSATRVQCTIDYDLVVKRLPDTELLHKAGVAAGSQVPLAAAGPDAAAAQAQEAQAVGTAVGGAVAAFAVAFDKHLDGAHDVLSIENPAAVAAKTREELQRLWYLDIRAVLEGKSRNDRTLGSCFLTIDEYLNEGKCTDEVELPVCVPMALAAGVYQKADLAAWRNEAIRKAIADELPAEDAPEFGAVHPMEDRLVFRQAIVPGVTDLGVTGGMVSHLLWDNESRQVIYVKILGRFEARALGGGNGVVRAVSLTGGAPIEIDKLDKALTVESIEDVSMEGRELVIKIAGGKVTRLSLASLPKAADDGWRLDTEGVWQARLHSRHWSAQLRDSRRPLDVPVSAHRYGRLPAPLLFVRAPDNREIGPSYEDLLAARIAQIVRWGDFARARVLLKRAEEFSSPEKLVRLNKDAEAATQAFGARLSADVRAVATMEEARLKVEGQEEARRLVVQAEMAFKKKHWEEAEQLANSARERDSSNERAAQIADQARSIRQAAEAEAEQRRVQREQGKILASVPRLKAQCMSAFSYYQRAVQVARNAAVHGNVGLARRAEAGVQTAVARVREAQQQLRAAIAIYRSRGEHNAARAIEQESYQCLRL